MAVSPPAVHHRNPERPTMKQKLAAVALFVLFGIGAASHGWREWSASRDAAALPVEVDLASLENGASPPNPHVRIGPHVACYYSTVGEFKTDRRRGKRRADATTRLTHCFYPIISPAQPFVQKLNELAEKHGGLDKVPEDTEPPAIDRFAVIVKTERFKKFGDIPDVPHRREAELQGLVINTLRPLGYKEKKLLKEEFPNMDFDKVLVVEENRKPSSWAWCATFQYGGVALIGAGLLLGVVFIVRGCMAK
jgi:hypothetical protein